jgi:CxxC motif-containing protein (DUF1111 family)
MTSVAETARHFGAPPPFDGMTPANRHSETAMTPAWNLRAALAALVLALSTLACVKRLPVGGAACPCPVGYCCDLKTNTCQASSSAACGVDGGVPRDAPPDQRPTSPDAHDGGGSDPIPTDGPLVPSTCTQALPPSFAVNCGGCHTAAGAANPRYPDLYKFSANYATFESKVRGGAANGMPSYTAAMISDAELQASYQYFRGNGRPVQDPTPLGTIVPIFSPADARNPPVVFMRSDGALVTRGAGRARNRHEANPTFMEWASNYYMVRTYGWIVVDEGQKLTISFLPNGTVTSGTNFRTWKAYDNGDVFKMNENLVANAELPDLTWGGQNLAADYATRIARYTQVQQQQVTQNRRDEAPLKPGDTCEFEFGIFYATDSIQPPGSRTAYYTDQFRYRVGRGGVTPDNVDGYMGMVPVGPKLDAQLGGDGTNVWARYSPELQFDQMALNIQHENVQSFVDGRRLFHTDFVDGAHLGNGVYAHAAFPEQAGKGDPLAQQHSCQACHVNNGSGELLTATLEESSTIIRLADTTIYERYLQPTEGWAKLTGMATTTVTLTSGQQVVLTKPVVTIATNSGDQVPYSARVATRLIGLGLLEAVDEKAILARVDALDCDHDGISGRASFAYGPEGGTVRVGRFGWKSDHATLREQVSELAFETMGVGSRHFPDAGKADLTDAELDQLVTFVRLLAVPGQRDATTVGNGERLFHTTGCAACHTSDLVTGPNHPFAELRNQAIKPYSDLLLHDMGQGLADWSAVADPGDTRGPASATEWRTAPLWGLGLVGTVSGRANDKLGLLHDGRAATILEAVLWHGGEGERAKQAFIALQPADREALLAFLASL